MPMKMFVITISALLLWSASALLAAEMEWEEGYDKTYHRERMAHRSKTNLWIGLHDQKNCPITYRPLKIRKNTPHVDYMGYRIYLSSEKLEWIFHKYPKRAIRRIFDRGQRPLKLDLCPFCGEEKNTYQCCRNMESTVICNKCGKHKNSPGCCVPNDFILPVPAPGDEK